jgi:hypothetical protein
MTRETAAALAALLDDEFEWVADRYAAHLEHDGGLEDVLADLRTLAGQS